MRTILFLLLSVYLGHGQCKTYTFIDFDAGTDGNALTIPLLNSSTHGYYRSNGLAGAGTLLFAASAQKSFVGPLSICNYGSFTGNGLVGFTADTATTCEWIIALSNDVAKVSWGYWFKSLVPGSSIAFLDSCFTSEDPSLGGPNDFLNIDLQSGVGNSDFRMGMEHHDGSDNHPTTGRIFTTNTWYWITAKQDTTVGGLYQVNWYDASLTLMTNLSATHEVGATNIHLIQVGNVIAGQSVAGQNLAFDNFVIDSSGNADFPLFPPGAGIVSRSGTGRAMKHIR